MSTTPISCEPHCCPCRGTVHIVAIVAGACLAALAVVVAGFVTVSVRNAIPHAATTPVAAHTWGSTKDSEWQRDAAKNLRCAELR